jgi:hypothetical protein
MQPLGRTGDAAGFHHRAEDVQIGQIHRSLSKMEYIIIIHFT